MFSPWITGRIGFLARRLRRVFWLTIEDAEDLIQDAVAELLGAMRRYQPALGTVDRYASGVLGLWYCHSARKLKRTRARTPRVLALTDAATGALLVDRGQIYRDNPGLRIDLEEAIGRLPRDLRELVELLKTKSVAEIAAERGVHRATVYRAVQRLRERLVSIVPWNEM